MTIREFQLLNSVRCYSPEAKKKWGDCRRRTIQDWALCLGGEVGELQNEVKKFTLYNLSIEDIEKTQLAILDEAADVITYANLLIDFTGHDVEQVLMRKFDEVSKRIGWQNVRP